MRMNSICKNGTILSLDLLNMMPLDIIQLNFYLAQSFSIIAGYTAFKCPCI